jgi:glycosyltransferase involved in cell wall biosynthesis
MGLKSRDRVENHFSWGSVAKQTLEFYRDLTSMVGKRKAKIE